VLVIYLAPLPRGFLPWGLLVRFDLALAVRCCGPAFATSRMNRSKRGHAS
jgi:hypothetical protein